MAVLDFYRSAVSHFLNGKLVLDSHVTAPLTAHRRLSELGLIHKHEVHRTAQVACVSRLVLPPSSLLYGALSEVDWRSRCTYLRTHWGWDPASQGLLSDVMTNCCSISMEHLVAWRKDVDFA